MKKLIVALLALICLNCAALAQNDAPKPADAREFFRFDFVLKELENGKPINSRSFQMMAEIYGTASSIRSGDRVPVSADGKTTYLDVGVNVDIKNLRREKDELELEVIAEVSSGESAPLIHQTKWISSVLIPIRKPTTIFSSDGPTGKRQLQLEVTATPVH